MENKYKKQYIVVAYQNKYEKVLTWLSRENYMSKENVIRNILEEYLTGDQMDHLLDIGDVSDDQPCYRVINSNLTCRNGRKMNGEKSPNRVKSRFMMEVSASMKLEMRVLAAEYKTSMSRIINVIVNDYCSKLEEQVPADFSVGKEVAMTKVMVRISASQLRSLKTSAKLSGRTLSQEIAMSLHKVVFEYGKDCFENAVENVESSSSNKKYDVRPALIPTKVMSAFNALVESMKEKVTKTTAYSAALSLA